jgi:Flp pilus assembly protein TadB
MRDLDAEQVDYYFPALSSWQKVRFIILIKSVATLNRMRRNVKLAISISVVVCLALVLIAYKLQNPTVSFVVGIVIGALITWAFFAIIFRGFFE